MACVILKKKQKKTRAQVLTASQHKTPGMTLSLILFLIIYLLLFFFFLTETVAISCKNVL